jgi:hypothetical protein
MSTGHCSPTREREVCCAQRNQSSKRGGFRKGVAVIGAAMLLTWAFTSSAQADFLTIEATFEFSGATPPAGSTPWLTAVFDDENTPGTVKMKLEATNLVADEFVSVWMFNLDPTLDPTLLSFSEVSRVGTFADPTITTGVDAFMADGDGKFDIRVQFSVAGGGAVRFGPGESIIYQISGIAGLSAASFDYLSAPAGGHGPFPMAAHVQGIGEGGEDSGWVTGDPGILIPEPGSMVLWAMGLVGLLLGGRRLRRQSA